VGYGSPSAGSDDEVGYGSRTWIVEQQRKVFARHCPAITPFRAIAETIESQ
jgi:hypothetical protein